MEDRLKRRASVDSDSYLKRATVRVERVFDAPPNRVFEAWTTPDLVSRWIWASLGQGVWAELDVRVGGAFRIYSRCVGGHHQGEGWSGMCGLYVEVDPGRKLVHTLHWDADVGYNRTGRLALDEVVSVTFAPEGERTRIVLEHIGIPDDGVSAATHRAGIEESLDMLAAVLAG
jgi:uncharacterized protein YndB with AHSA1/START domain